MSFKVYGICRLTKEPELRKTQSGTSVCQFSVASNREFKNANGEYESDFLNCQAWRNQADFIANYIHKGDQVFIEGTIQTGSYEKEGRKVYTTDLVVSNIKTLEKREKATQPTESADFTPDLDITEDELPFSYLM